MEVKSVVDALQEIKAAYPSMTNAEILKVMELRLIMERNALERR